jgi:hypothetical protein
MIRPLHKKLLHKADLLQLSPRPKVHRDKKVIKTKKQSLRNKIKVFFSKRKQLNNKQQVELKGRIKEKIRISELKR